MIRKFLNPKLSKNVFQKQTNVLISKFSSVQESYKISRRFEYGQDSAMDVNTQQLKSNTEITTLWEDHSEVEIESHVLSIDKLSDLYKFTDNGRDIGFEYDQSQENMPTHSEEDQHKINLKLPEYSNLKIKCRGDIVQRNTSISAKIKGDISIENIDTDLNSVIDFQRVKTENASVEMINSSFFVRKYWETMDGIFKKVGAGRIQINRMGVSNFVEFDLADTDVKISNIYANSDPINLDHEQKEMINFKMQRGTADINTVVGSLKLDLVDCNGFKIEDGNFQKIKISAKNSTIDIYFENIKGGSTIELNNCIMNIRVNPEIKDKFEEFVTIHSDDESEVKFIYQENKTNSFTNLTQKFAEIKKRREQELS